MNNRKIYTETMPCVFSDRILPTINMGFQIEHVYSPSIQLAGNALGVYLQTVKTMWIQRKLENLAGGNIHFDHG